MDGVIRADLELSHKVDVRISGILGDLLSPNEPPLVWYLVCHELGRWLVTLRCPERAETSTHPWISRRNTVF